MDDKKNDPLIRLTDEHVRRAATYPNWNGGCGWTRKQLALIGVPWPPPEGWRGKIKNGQGPMLPNSVIARFIVSSKKRTKKFKAKVTKRRAKRNSG